MSDTIYPVGLVKQINTLPFARVTRDEFESGDSASRRVWPAQYFKRRLRINHAPFTLDEFKWLRSFYSQRNGIFDSFWFRDNLNRQGNVKARFSVPMPNARDTDLTNVEVALDEIAPIRAFPEFDEVSAATGVAPLLWWDANREFYLTHKGTIFKESRVYDAYGQTWRPVWQDGSALNLDGAASQYQAYKFTSTEWAKTATNLTGLTGTQPGVSVFCFAKHSPSMSRTVLFCAGAMGAGNAVGIELNDAGRYTPFLGGSETWAESFFANLPEDTWRSLMFSWPSGSNTPVMHINGIQGDDQVDVNTRNYTAGPAVLGAAIDGTLKVGTGGGMPSYLLAESGDILTTEGGDRLVLESSMGGAAVTGYVNHVMIFPAYMDNAQVRVLHNLFAYQYGVALA